MPIHKLKCKGLLSMSIDRKHPFPENNDIQ